MPRQKTHEEFLQQVFDLVGDEYQVLEQYQRTATKLSMKHITCDNTFLVRPADFLRGTRCPICFKQAKRTINSVMEDVVSNGFN
jgi:hypothetical protein